MDLVRADVADDATRRLGAGDGVVYAAAAPLERRPRRMRGIGGRYFEDCHEAEVVPALRGLSGVLPHALDPDAARRLWDVSERLLSQARVGATG